MLFVCVLHVCVTCLCCMCAAERLPDRSSKLLWWEDLDDESDRKVRAYQCECISVAVSAYQCECISV